MSVVWSRPATVARTLSPPGGLTETSPSSAKASSAVTRRPGFQTNPVDRDRCELTDAMLCLACATAPAMAEDSEERAAMVGSDIEISHWVSEIWGFRIDLGTAWMGRMRRQIAFSQPESELFKADMTALWRRTFER
jgi:hypothetical protein